MIGAWFTSLSALSPVRGDCKKVPGTFLLGLALFLPDSLSAGPRSLAYRITPKLEASPARLEIELHVSGDNPALTRLLLPREWAGQKEFDRGIGEITVLSPHQSVKRLTDPPAVEIRQAAGTEIRLRYTVTQYWNGPITREVYYRPLLQPTYFHFIGYGAFARPEWNGGEAIPVELRWEGLPREFALANSFGTGQPVQKFTASLNDLRQAVYVGGDFRVKRLDVREQPVYVASRGEWKFPLDGYYSLIRRIVEEQRDFWNDHDFPYFLITMIPLDQRCCALGGTGLTQSFATFVYPELDRIEEFHHLLTHELFHTWNGRKIRRMHPEQLVYWFSEGFTDYYTRLLNLRAGLLDLEEYARQYNRVVRQYFLSKERHSSNRKLVQEFWNNDGLHKLPYLRGDILAHYWNAQIKKRGPHSLDSLMHDILREATRSGWVVTPEGVSQLAAPYLGRNPRADIARYIEGGDTLPLHPQALGPCFSLTPKTIYEFDLGFALTERGDKPVTVQGVRPGGPAHRAGLRNGQRIVGKSIYWHQPDREAGFLVEEAERKRRWIRYLPRGHAHQVPQYELNRSRYETNPGSCLSWFRKAPSPIHAKAPPAGERS